MASSAAAATARSTEPSASTTRGMNVRIEAYHPLCISTLDGAGFGGVLVIMRRALPRSPRDLRSLHFV